MRFKIAFERKNGKLIQISINFRDNIDEVKSHGNLNLFLENEYQKKSPNKMPEESL
jgi:hypothetical protein